MEYSWKGKDGVVYYVTQVENRHLLYAHRLFRERLAKYLDMGEGEKLWISQNRIDNTVQELNRGIKALQIEIEERKLSPLPTRTEEEQLAVSLKVKAYQEQRQKEIAQIQQEKSNYQTEIEQLRKTRARLKKLQREHEKLKREIETLTPHDIEEPTQQERRIVLMDKPKKQGE